MQLIGPSLRLRVPFGGSEAWLQEGKKRPIARLSLSIVTDATGSIARVARAPELEKFLAECGMPLAEDATHLELRAGHLPVIHEPLWSRARVVQGFQVAEGLGCRVSAAAAEFTFFGINMDRIRRAGGLIGCLALFVGVGIAWHLATTQDYA